MAADPTEVRTSGDLSALSAQLVEELSLRDASAAVVETVDTPLHSSTTEFPAARPTGGISKPRWRNAKAPVSGPGMPTRAERPDFGPDGGAQAEWPYNRGGDPESPRSRSASKESAAAPSAKESAAAGMNWTVVVVLCIVLAWLTGLIVWFTSGLPAAAYTKIFDGKE